MEGLKLGFDLSKVITPLERFKQATKADQLYWYADSLPALKLIVERNNVNEAGKLEEVETDEASCCYGLGGDWYQFIYPVPNQEA